MRARLILAVLLTAIGVGSARAQTQTQTFPASLIPLSPSGQVSLQLTLETGTFSVQDRVFVYKYCYTLKNTSLTGARYVATGMNPDCDDPFATEPPVVTPSTKSADWRGATFPLDMPVDPTWFATKSASGLATGESAKLVLYSNTPPARGELFLTGVVNGSTTPRFDTLLYWHPDCSLERCPPENGVPVICRGPFELPQAYPARPAAYPEPAIAPNNCFAGNQAKGPANVSVVSGVFCLDSELVDGVPVLNVAAFATCPPSQSDPYVQSYRLIKEEAPSRKCPETYRHRIWTMYGKDVRTWWALRYTPPGTTFTLELMVRCKDLRRPGGFAFHINRWTWRVTATIDSLILVAQALHTNSIGGLDVPCIVGEDTYLALQKGLATLKAATTRRAKEDALFALEALITANGVFTDVVTPKLWAPLCAPENPARLTKEGWIGIMESLENPCVCKLIADLEHIGVRLGISVLQ